MATGKSECLHSLMVGKFDEALELADGLNLKYRAIHTAIGPIVVERNGGVLYEAETVEDAYEAEILALWHSLDDDATFETIVINGMGKHYVNGVRVLD